MSHNWNNTGVYMSCHTATYLSIPLHLFTKLYITQVDVAKTWQNKRNTNAFGAVKGLITNVHLIYISENTQERNHMYVVCVTENSNPLLSSPHTLEHIQERNHTHVMFEFLLTNIT